MSTPEIKKEVPVNGIDKDAQDTQNTQDASINNDVEMTDVIPKENTADEQTAEQTAESITATPQVIDYAEESRKIEEKARIYLARQTKPVIIPAFAAWFSLETVHEIEKRSLPEFFNNNSRFKTEKIYKDIRNFMVNTFRLNPIEYLTVTAARRNIAADVASIIRIHAFLEQWGLINYQIDPKTKPSLLGPQYTGHFQIILDTPDGLKPFVPENPKVINRPTPKETEETKTIDEEKSDIPLNLELRRNVYDSSQDALSLNEQDRLTSTLNTKQFTCYVTGNDSTEVRYHNLRSKSSISARAFKESHFGANFQASDFVRLENLQKHGDAAPWTEQEVLLLLEGVEMFDDDWEKIAGHVGSRNKEQSIAKFIQLPIEDKYLFDSLKRAKATVQSNDENSKDLLEPNSTNDAVFKTIKFLIKNVNPELASRDFLQNDEDVQKAIKTTLGTIIGSSQVEQKNITSESSKLLSNLVDLEISKLDLKLNKLSILEKQMNQERAELAQQRKDLILDRLSLKKQSLNVRNKLIEASQAAPEEADKLSKEALEIASKAPRVVVISNNEISKGLTDVNGEEKKEEEEENIVPVSIDTPETYQYWKL